MPDARPPNPNELTSDAADRAASMSTTVRDAPGEACSSTSHPLATSMMASSARPARPGRQLSSHGHPGPHHRRFEATPDLNVCSNGIARAEADYLHAPPRQQLADMDESIGVEAESSSDVTQSSSTWQERFRTGLRFRTLHFTPSWFSVNMGTGITSVLLWNFPYHVEAFRRIALGIFGLNIVLFLIFLSLSIARYLIWRTVFTAMINHPMQSLFLGTFPMGGTTIIVMLIFTLGKNSLAWARFAWALWWIDVAVTLVIGFGIPFVMFTRHRHEIGGLSAVWLQPVVAAVVCASSGAVVASALTPSEARLTILACYVLWGTGVPIAFLIFALYYLRLCVHKIPPAEQIVSVFLPLGPCGQGAYGLLLLSAGLRRLAYQENLGLILPATVLGPDEAKTIASAIYGISIVVALILWGVGAFWFVTACATILHMTRKGGFPFNMGWWGFTFPIGTFAVAANTFAVELSSTPFRVIGTVLSSLEILLWLYIASRTAYGAFTGTMFIAPCLNPTGGRPPRKDELEKGVV